MPVGVKPACQHSRYASELMRIVLFSDIHGNRIALDAVLEDARQLGADAYWAIGDLAAIGPEPVAVLETLAALPALTVIRGNADRYIVTGERPWPDYEDAKGDSELLDLWRRIEASFSWTRGSVTAQGWLDWLDALPVEARVTLPGGERLLGVHASPGTDDGEGIHVAQSDARLAELVADCDADIVCAGHTHEPLLRQVGDVTAVNLGCVGNPTAPDLRASYVFIDAGGPRAKIAHRRVGYDRDAFLETLRKSRHPEAAFIESFQHSGRAPRKPHPDHRPLV